MREILSALSIIEELEMVPGAHGGRFSFTRIVFASRKSTGRRCATCAATSRKVAIGGSLQADLELPASTTVSMVAMARVLLLLPTTTYRTADFLAAARGLGVEVTVASERASTLEGLNPEGLLTLDFRDPAASARRVVEFAGRTPFAAVVGVDEDTTVVAAVISRALGLPHNPVQAAMAARHKATMRGLLAEAAVPSPGYRVFDRGEDPEAASKKVRFPCVLKPTFLAASRGVIRANDRGEFVAAWRRIERILDEPEVAAKGGEAAKEILVEDFVSGREVARRGFAAGRGAEGPGDLRQARSARGALLRRDDLRYAVAAARADAGADRCGSPRTGRSRSGCAMGRSTRSCASTRQGPGSSRSRRGRSEGSARGRCGSGRACRSRS